MAEQNSYLCVNCGNRVKHLYREYSPSVLKLINCEKCGNVADKYIEYDRIIILIDLILLSKEGYRHVLYNSHYNVNIIKMKIF
ncbi:arv1, putative [Pediculus humanus corporis]|uniref:Protein ARV n=1 Tax=Pediculus humanus subsp. corporis TaxID=121224 RepID=E0W078_PEDHC|nr:arv1, putative [Pediculus humanus corporis]EEB19034.1 arv1, putative [Pediculus humanus corporis]